MFGGQSGQYFAGILGVIEGQRGGTVGANDLGKNANVYGERAPKRHPLIDNQRGAHEKKRETARQQDD